MSLKRPTFCCAISATTCPGRSVAANRAKPVAWNTSPRLKVGDLLYLCSVRQLAIALDAATGQVRWRFDPHIDVGHTSQHLTCRGLAWYEGTDATSQAPASAPAAVWPPACVRRIFLPTIDARLFALDAQTGEPCLDFGDKGVVDPGAGMPNLRAGACMQTSPPVVAGDVVIVGGSINDNASVHTPSGVIRAFDARSGQLVWNFDPDRPDATAPLLPGQAYTDTAGAPNHWAPSSVDAQLGLACVGLGNRCTRVYPGNLGVFNWGGVAVDPVRQIMVGVPAFLAFPFQLIPRPDATAIVVSAGASEHRNENLGAAHAVKIGPFLSPLGLPCQAPPWGAIAGALPARA